MTRISPAISRWPSAISKSAGGQQIFAATIEWSPPLGYGLSRYETPVRPVVDFTVISDGEDVSAEYRLHSAGGLIAPNWLVRADGLGFPNDAADASKRQPPASAAKFKKGDEISMTGTVTIVHDEEYGPRRVTVRLEGYDPITVSDEYVDLVARAEPTATLPQTRGGGKASRRKQPLFDEAD